MRNELCSFPPPGLAVDGALSTEQFELSPSDRVGSVSHRLTLMDGLSNDQGLAGAVIQPRTQPCRVYRMIHRAKLVDQVPKPSINIWPVRWGVCNFSESWAGCGNTHQLESHRFLQISSVDRSRSFAGRRTPSNRSFRLLFGRQCRSSQS